MLQIRIDQEKSRQKNWIKAFSKTSFFILWKDLKASQIFQAFTSKPKHTKNFIRDSFSFAEIGFQFLQVLKAF